MGGVLVAQKDAVVALVSWSHDMAKANDQQSNPVSVDYYTVSIMMYYLVISES